MSGKNIWELSQNKLIRSAGVFRAAKILIFCLLIAVEIIIAVMNARGREGLEYAIWVILGIEIALTAENAVKMWVLKKFRGKIACYVLDTLLLLVLTYFTDGTLISTLYIIILSEFYISQEKLSGSIAMGACSIVLFLVMFGVSHSFGERIDLGWILSNAFNDLIILVLHFLIINFTLLLYRKNAEIAKTVEELNLSNEKLRRANEELQAVTVLEERQRIAKEIHDTAGHSITTVIMQTEAAKLVIESDPADAKRKIAAANLQARHALEELRESVHLLSGSETKPSLRDALVDIIHESTDGTGIVIRYEIQALELCDAKTRFLMNTLKEGISNGLRHGGATAFWFELREEGDKVMFLLSDNGRGVKLSALKEGFGLSGMHKRAESLGGSLWFETEAGDGFEIHLTLPMDGEL